MAFRMRIPTLSKDDWICAGGSDRSAGGFSEGVGASRMLSEVVFSSLGKKAAMLGWYGRLREDTAGAIVDAD